MEKDKFERRATIIGRVLPHEGDGLNVNGIEISTDDDTYIVEMDYVGEDLLEFLDKDVKATGFINRYIDGTYRIVLDDYEILDEEDDDEYNDYVETELDFHDDYLLEDEY